jgi:hypothetical protein
MQRKTLEAEPLDSKYDTTQRKKATNKGANTRIIDKSNAYQSILKTARCALAFVRFVSFSLRPVVGSLSF